MWIPKGATLIRGHRLFEARHLLEEIKYQMWCNHSFSQRNKATKRTEGGSTGRAEQNLKKGESRQYRGVFIK